MGIGKERNYCVQKKENAQKEVKKITAITTNKLISVYSRGC